MSVIARVRICTVLKKPLHHLPLLCISGKHERRLSGSGGDAAQIDPGLIYSGTVMDEQLRDANMSRARRLAHWRIIALIEGVHVSARRYELPHHFNMPAASCCVEGQVSTGTVAELHSIVGRSSVRVRPIREQPRDLIDVSHICE